MTEQALHEIADERVDVPAQTVDELVATVASALPVAVDTLHVAAELESRGLTDRMAAEQFGQRDVFDLAETVAAALPAPSEDSVTAVDTPEPDKPHFLTVLAHGPLYGLISLVYPAVYIWLSGAVMLRGLVVATAFGWIWSMGMSTAIHRLRDEKRFRAAAELAHRLVIAGLLAAGLLATGFAFLDEGGVPLIAFVVGQVGFQLGAAIFVIYGLERRLVLIMLPAAAAGATHSLLGSRQQSIGPVLIAGLISCTALVLWALASTREYATRTDPPGGIALRKLAIVVVPGLWYAAVCATLLLFTDARFLTARFDLSIGVVPLVLGMGVLELRSYRYSEQARDLLREILSPEEYGRRMWRVAVREILICMLALGLLGFGLLTVLAATGQLTNRGAMLVDAHIILGGALYMGFIIANLGLFRPLLAVVTSVVALDVIATLLWARLFAPHGEIPIFLISCITLVVALLVVLRKNVGVVYHYR